MLEFKIQKVGISDIKQNLGSIIPPLIAIQESCFANLFLFFEQRVDKTIEENWIVTIQSKTKQNNFDKESLWLPLQKNDINLDIFRK